MASTTAPLHPDTARFFNSRFGWRRRRAAAFSTVESPDSTPSKPDFLAGTAGGWDFRQAEDYPYIDLWDGLQTLQQSDSKEKRFRPDITRLGVPYTQQLQADLVRLRKDPSKEEASSTTEGIRFKQLRLLESWRRKDFHRRQRRVHLMQHYAANLQEEMADHDTLLRELQQPFLYPFAHSRA